MQTTGAILKTRITIASLLFVILVSWDFQAIGEEWTAEQEEVWKAIEADTELFKKGDLERIMGSRVDDAIIWWSDRPIPFDKELVLFNYRWWFNYDLPVNWELKPLAVKVYGDLAIVAYRYKFSGKILSGSGRIMENWIKQDNKWLLMSSFEVSCNKLPHCE